MEDCVSTLMFDLGSSGVQTDDGTGDPIALTAYFPEASDQDRVVAGLKDLLGPTANLTFDAVADEDWTTKWREHFEPIYPTDKIVVHPPWRPVAAPEGGFALAIEPKTAFGTGSHPTTKMAMLALEQTVRPEDRVLDVGTGSGILSIAAVKLGASDVLAVDTDPLATENVDENVALNGVEGIRVETRGVGLSDTGFHVVVANIIRSVLTPLLPALANAALPGGHLIFGGLLDREEIQFRESVEGAGLRVEEVTREAEWIGMIARAST